MIFFSIATFDQLSVLTFVFIRLRQCSRLKALGRQFNKTLSFCVYNIHSVLLVLLGIYDWYLITHGFFFDCMYYLVKSLPLLAHFWQLHRNQRILAKSSFVLLNFFLKSFTIEKVIGAKASTQSNQFVLTTRCCKLSSKGIQFGKGKHLLNCSHYFEEHTLLKLHSYSWDTLQN